MLTIDDRPSAGMSGTAARTKFVTLVKFSRTRESWPLSLTSRNGARNPPPALFTTTSSRPSVPTHSRTASPSRTSSTAVDTRRPAVSTSAAVRAKPSASRSQMARSAPKRAHAPATAAPMP